MIKDYIDVGIKNDDQLVKLSAVLQRFISGKSNYEESSVGGVLSEEEKNQLLSSVKTEISNLEKDNRGLDKELNKINKKITKDGT